MVRRWKQYRRNGPRRFDVNVDSEVEHHLFTRVGCGVASITRLHDTHLVDISSYQHHRNASTLQRHAQQYKLRYLRRLSPALPQPQPHTHTHSTPPWQNNRSTYHKFSCFSSSPSSPYDGTSASPPRQAREQHPTAPQYA
jgi:hypothetical protein